MVPDIGRFDRDLSFGMVGTTHTAAVRAVGKMAGVVRIDGGEKIAPGTYNATFETKKSAKLYSDTPGLELELDAVREPAFLESVTRPAGRRRRGGRSGRR